MKHNSFALYVHLPFCVRKCPYCAFASDEIKSVDNIDGIIQAIAQEAKMYASDSFWGSKKVHSIFLGGGTPSILGGHQIQFLLEKIKSIYSLTTDCEITIEINPGTLNKEKLSAWKNSGINRASLGVQSLHQPTLNKLGRIHTVEQSHKAFSLLKNAGFNRISVDLMYGIYAENALQGWKDTVEEIISWNPDHISAYALILEPGTPFYDAALNSENVKLDEDSEIEQYNYILKRLRESNFYHYELSNWAKNESEISRHNLSYWNGSPYLALGPSSHSFDGMNRRFWNWKTTAAWMQKINSGHPGIESEEILTSEQIFEEKVMLGLRLINGISETSLSDTASVAGKNWPPAALDELLFEGYLQRENGRLRYADKGLVLAGEIEALLTR